jgi:hypothetical protein
MAIVDKTDYDGLATMVMESLDGMDEKKLVQAACILLDVQIMWSDVDDAYLVLYPDEDEEEDTSA